MQNDINKMQKAEKLKLPENRNPNVIEKNMVWEAIGVGHQIDQGKMFRKEKYFDIEPHHFYKQF